MNGLCIPIACGLLRQGKRYKLCFRRKLTPERKVRQQLLQSNVLNCRGRLGGGERREVLAVIKTYMKPLRSSRDGV